jgi:hypothetical protein
MKNLKIFIIVVSNEKQSLDLTKFEGENVKSIAIIDQEDMEENVAQLLECNLVVSCTNETSAEIKNSLTVARILNREIIHFSKLPKYVK